MRHEVSLAVDRKAPTLARGFLASVAEAPWFASRRDDAELALGELVANAVVHGDGSGNGGVIRVVVDSDQQRLRIEVEQPGSARGARVAEPRIEGRPGGWGLRLVEGVTDKWGAEAGPPGRVWFEIRP